MAGIIDTLSLDEQLELIYIGYFNRAGDPGGFDFWQQQNAQAQAGGQSAAQALTNIANSFTPQPETVALYPFLGTALTYPVTSPTILAQIGGLVDMVYQNLFNRAPDAEGRAYWVNELATGNVALGTAILAIANGAQGDDAAILNNKVDAALDFTIDTGAAGLGFNAQPGDSFVQQAAAVIAGVTADAATVTSAAAATDAFVGGGVEGQTFTLTTSVDNVVGTTGNDTIIGVFGDATNANNTFNVGDLIDGDAGTDTLSLTAQDTTTSSAALTVKNVEHIVVRDLVGATVDALPIENSPTISFTNTLAAQTSTVNNASTASTFGLAGKGDLTVDFATTSGTADTAKLSLDGVGTSATVRSTVNVADGNTIEAVTVATTGTNFVSLNAGSAAATITVTGNGTNDIDVDSAAAALTLDASTSTGTNTFVVGTVLSSTDTVKGGTGADTLSANLTAATQINPTITGIETLKLDFDAAATMNLSKTTGATTLTLAGSSADQSVTNAAAELATVNVTSQADADNDLNLSYATGVSADLTVNIGSTATTAANITMDDFVLTRAGSLTFNTVGTKDHTIDDVSVGALTALNFNVGVDGELNTGTLTAVGAIGAISTDVAASGVLNTDINASKGVGDVSLTLGDGASGFMTIDGSGGDVGNVSLTLSDGDSGYVSAYAGGSGASGGNVGDLSLTITSGGSGQLRGYANSGNVGDITMHIMGNGASGYVSAYASGYSADAAGSGTAGNIGDITVTLDNGSGSVSGHATLFANASSGNIGDVTMTILGADASGSAYVYASDWGRTNASAGASGDIGDFTLTIGDRASGGSYYFGASGSIGDANITIGEDVASAYVSAYGSGGTTGDLTATVGDNSDINVRWSNYSAGDINMVDVTLGEGASGYVSAYVASGDVGATRLDAADNAEFTLRVNSVDGSVGSIDVTGTAASAYVRADGDVSVGDINVASATNIQVDLQGDGATTFGSVVLTGGKAGSTGSVAASTAASGGTSIDGVDTTGYAGNASINLSQIATGTTIQVGNGTNNITGTNGADNIYGGTAVDSITGGAGVDLMVGGAGADVYNFTDVDTDLDTADGSAAVTDEIQGFVTGSDTLNFDTAGAGIYVENLADAGSWAALTTAAGTALDGADQYYFGTLNGDGFLFFDVDGTGITSVIQLTGVTDMAETDIV